MKLTPVLPPTTEEFNTLVVELNDFNTAVTGPLFKEKISSFIRDDSGQIVGGIVADIVWGWLYIEGLWVDAKLRKMGWGSDLLACIEHYAMDLGITNFRLETTSFGALGFYQKAGYSLFGELQDMPPGHTCYFLKKQH